MQLLVFATLLCFTTWMSAVQATHGRVANCCIQWSTTRIPLNRVKNYTIQSEGVCPISAVMVRTVQGKTLCSDPNSMWAKRVIEKVDRETKALLEKGQSEEGSTSDMTAVSTSPKNEPQQKCRKGRRRQRKQNRRGRNNQKKAV